MRKIVALIIVFSALLVGCAPPPKPIGWALLRPSTSPPNLSHSGFAYDSASSEAVVFGGLTKNTWSGETWVWNGENWLKASPPVSPSAREKLAMAYDEARDKIVLFGGMMDKTVFDDTWEWNGNNWELINPIHKPPARCCHAVDYDNVQKKVLLYGGWNHLTGEFFSDSWEWDGKDWVEVTCCGTPPASAHTLLNFSARNEIMLLNSVDFGSWVWDGKSWQSPSIDLPPARQDGRVAYDRKYQRAILFGGIHNNEYLNDTWLFDGQTWSILNLPTQPTARYSHIMFYDTKRQSIILFSGAGSDDALEDTWELNLPEDLSSFLFGATSTP